MKYTIKTFTSSLLFYESQACKVLLIVAVLNRNLMLIQCIIYIVLIVLLLVFFSVFLFTLSCKFHVFCLYYFTISVHFKHILIAILLLISSCCFFFCLYFMSLVTYFLAQILSSYIQFFVMFHCIRLTALSITTGPLFKVANFLSGHFQTRKIATCFFFL